MQCLQPDKGPQIVQQNATPFWSSRGVSGCWWTTNVIPNLELHNSMMLVIVSLFSLLCTPYSSLGSSNGLLHLDDKLGVSLTLYPCNNRNVYEVYQLLPKKSSAGESFVLELT